MKSAVWGTFIRFRGPKALDHKHENALGSHGRDRGLLRDKLLAERVDYPAPQSIKQIREVFPLLMARSCLLRRDRANEKSPPNPSRPSSWDLARRIIIGFAEAGDPQSRMHP
jgi:hypothetical protein